MKNTISIIVAIDEKNAIGKDSNLLIRLPLDMKMFREKTIDNVVIMGRKTFESMNRKPLVNRDNIIITNDKNYEAQGCEILHSIDECLAYIDNKYNNKEIFIIGGGEIYRQFIQFADKAYITEIRNTFPDVNIYFPEMDMNIWEEINRIYNHKDNKHIYDFDFVEYKKKQG